jgi:S1-C subfamily serine protease
VSSTRYRDFAGREAQPGTYDALTHLLFSPPPTAGSSGGPIVDESGAVVGIMQGHRMDYASRIEGIRGWGVPSETVFEVSVFKTCSPRGL